MVFEKSLQYLNSMRIKVLQEEGGNKKIIKELLRASLECSHFVEALKLQVDRIMSQIEIYQTHDYLRESLHDDSALEKISTSTKQLEKDVKKKISELSQLTQDLITLVPLTRKIYTVTSRTNSTRVPGIQPSVHP
ncbi:hypothetical protein BDV59DRAFT_183689 [Aspergillus ambiguus]|uniref:uncharacterized protein n=1 Tax=Aspergillus ambiguus TaxID=176160 RepID=UPI003CCE1AB1